jgi:hypothetical protein
MSDEAKQRRGSVGGLMLMLLGGLTLYVLSSGPALWVVLNFPNPVMEISLELTYLPLIVASQSLPIVGRLWEAYLTLWGA